MCCFTGVFLWFPLLCSQVSGPVQQQGLSMLNIPSSSWWEPCPLHSAPSVRSPVCDIDMTPCGAPALCWQHCHPPFSFTCSEPERQNHAYGRFQGTSPARLLESGDPGWKRFFTILRTMERKHYIGLQWKVHFTDKGNWGPEKGDGGVLREDGAGWSGRRLRFKPQFLHVLALGPWTSHGLSLNLDFLSCKMVVPASWWSHWED